jgi:hypothetical protein
MKELCCYVCGRHYTPGAVGWETEEKFDETLRFCPRCRRDHPTIVTLGELVKFHQEKLKEEP